MANDNIDYYCTQHYSQCAISNSNVEHNNGGIFMKKKITRRLLALTLCLAMCLVTTVTAFAADIPYKNCHTTGTGDYSFTIKTTDFSGYGSTSIGHFTVETSGYSAGSYITVTIYYGNNAVGFAMPGSNEKLENLSFDENFYYPAGTYRVVVSVTGSGASSGWTGIWLYH